ncbi:MAG: flippase [Oscillospiraceae bacterium]|nr:flippase [Oscillospiraceae bacterium]
MPTIKKNFFYQSLYQLLITLLPLAIAPYVSRVLGAENIGIYSFTFSIVTYFIYFARLGITEHGSRSIAAVRDDKEKLNKTFSNLFFLHLIGAFIVFSLYVVFLVFIAKEYRLYFVIQSITVLSALFDINWLFLGLEQVKFTVMRSMSVRLFAFTSVFVFVKTPDDLWKYAFIMSLGTFMGQTVVWVFVRRFVTFVKPSLGGMKPHIKPLLILFLPVIAVSVYNILDKIILGAATDKIQLGFYENSQKIIIVPIGFITAFNTIMLPRISNINAKGNTAEKERLTLISVKYVMLLAFAVTFGIAAVADRFAPWFFGGEFRECAVLIKTLCLMIPFLAFQNVITSQYLIPAGKDKTYTASTIAGAVINIAANLVLIPRFGALGAVISTVLAESLRCFIVVFAAKKKLPLGVYIKNSLFFIFAGAAMYGLVIYVGIAASNLPMTILIQVMTGVGFYLLASGIYLYLTKDAFFMNNIVKRLFRST